MSTPEYHKEYYQRNKDKIRERQKSWKEANIDRIRVKEKEYREQTKERSKAWRDNNKEQLFFLSLKSRATKKGLEFDLDPEDVLGITRCPVLGVDLVRSTDGKPKWNSPSVDRIDNTKGYVKGNVRVMSYLANSMKRDATPEQLKAFAKWVLSEYPEEPL